jgi:hypothetical protein
MLLNLFGAPSPPEIVIVVSVGGVVLVSIVNVCPVSAIGIISVDCMPADTCTDVVVYVVSSMVNLYGIGFEAMHALAFTHCNVYPISPF